MDGLPVVGPRLSFGTSTFSIFCRVWRSFIEGMEIALRKPQYIYIYICFFCWGADFWANHMLVFGSVLQV